MFFFDSYYIFEAQEALFAIRSTLQACLNPNCLEFIIQVVKGARFNTVELFIYARDEFFNARQYKDQKDKFDAVPSHPLAFREMFKEYEDLQRLKEMKTLDYNFIEWLRTSFDNDGKSIIDAL